MKNLNKRMTISSILITRNKPQFVMWPTTSYFGRHLDFLQFSLWTLSSVLSVYMYVSRLFQTCLYDRDFQPYLIEIQQLQLSTLSWTLLSRNLIQQLMSMPRRERGRRTWENLMSLRQNIPSSEDNVITLPRLYLHIIFVSLQRSSLGTVLWYKITSIMAHSEPMHTTDSRKCERGQSAHWLFVHERHIIRLIKTIRCAIYPYYKNAYMRKRWD